MAGSGPVIVAGTIKVPPENLGRLTPYIRTYVDACQKESGCIAFSFAEDLSTPGLIRIFEIWRDMSALERHRSAEHVAVWRALWAEYGVHGRSLTRYEISGQEPL